MSDQKRKITTVDLKSSLLTHPYDSNPDYFAKITFPYFSPDNKVVSFYWEAPVGSFDYELTYDEIIYMLEGEVNVTCKNEKLNIKSGEIYSAKIGDRLEFNIIKPIKAFGFVYPASEELLSVIKTLKK